MLATVFSKRYLAPVCAALMVLAVGLTGEYGYRLEKGRIKQDQRGRVISALGQYRAALEGELNGTLYTANGLVAYVESHTNLEKNSIQTMLHILYEQGGAGHYVRNIGLAPGNRLEYVYPLAGNEKALGLYYPDSPEQWPAVAEAIRERKSRLAGPLALRQGGTGFIYRMPIFVGNKGHYWGLLSMVLDQEKLLAKVGLAEKVNGVQFALRGKDGRGADGGVFLGDDSLFTAESDAELATIITPGGTWQLAALPVKGWTTGSRMSWFRISAWGAGLLLGTFLYWAMISVSRRLQAEELIKANEERQRLSLTGADLATVDWAVNDHSLDFGTGWSKLLGYDPKELRIHTHFLATLSEPSDWDRVRPALVEHLKGQNDFFEAEVRMKHKAGHWVWVLVRGMVVERRADGRAVRMAGTLMDITQRKQIEADVIRLSRWNELILNSAGEGIFGVDRKGLCTFINPAALSLMGYERQEVLGARPHELFYSYSPDFDAQGGQICPILSTLVDGIRRAGEEKFVRKTGDTFPVHLTITPMHEDGQLIGAVVVFQDISRRKSLEQELLQLANTDALTGISNRRRFLEQLDMALHQGLRTGECGAMLMLDLDYFKNVNDQYGHAVGDAALIHFSQLARHRLQGDALFGRLGGEEFGVFLPGMDRDSAVQCAERLRRYVAENPLRTSKVELALTVSIGLSMQNPGESDADALILRADVALYQAKQQGRDRVIVH